MTAGEEYLKNRMCYLCGTTDTSYWRRYYNKGIRTGKHICNKCYHVTIKGTEKDLNHIKKELADSRTGNIDRFSDPGKGLIGQWMSGKTLGIKDLNIENNNLEWHIDLSDHPIHRKIDSKIRTLHSVHQYWNVKLHTCYFDTVIILCMDRHKLWKDVERVYVVPKDKMKCMTSITIYRGSVFADKYYEEFRVDDKPYNNTYHSVDIPRFFSPFDLWKGRYNKDV